MLRITVPSTGSSGLTFSTFERYGLPSPPNGADAEINNDLVLRFDNEEEAISYAEQLEDLSNNRDDESSAIDAAINDIILAIRSDEFVQTYNEEN